MRRHTCFTRTYPLLTVRSPSKSNSKQKKSKLSNSSATSAIGSPWDKFIEVIDIITQESVGYVSCKSCKLIVKCETQLVNSHLCKQKDVDKNCEIGNNLMFRSKPKSRTTPIWDGFEEVIDPTTSNILGYVRCKSCREIIKSSDPKSIPSVLRKHHSNCPFNSNLNTSTLAIQQSNVEPTHAIVKQSVSKTVLTQNEIRDRCLHFCCSELVNLSAINSSSFKQLAQSLVNLGAMMGKTSLNLPDMGQLTTQLDAMYSSERDIARTNLCKALEQNIGGCLVCDYQDDKCILTFYQIDNNFNMVQSILNASVAVRETSSFINATFTDYNLTDGQKLSEFTFMSQPTVTCDSISVRLTSIAHAIDLVVESTLMEYSHTEDIENCRVICRELGLNISIDREIEGIEWIHKYEYMHLTIDNQSRFELKNVTLDLNLIKVMVELLKPFREACVELRKCRKRPTLNHVVLWYYKLFKILNAPLISKETEVYEKSLKESLKTHVEQHFQLHTFHKVAAFLWPNFRHLKMLPDLERLKIHQEVRNLLNSRFPESGDFSCSVKKARSDFSDWEDVNDTEQDEVDSYVSAMLTTCNEDNILTWWREHQADFPRLSALVKWVLCIPASVTTFEQLKLQISNGDVDHRLLFLRCNE